MADGKETWRPVTGYGPVIGSLYEVSSMGRVRSHGRWIHYMKVSGLPAKYWKPGRMLRLSKASPPGGGKAYAGVHLRAGPRVHTVHVHVLVLEAFVGPRPDGMFGCHNDDDKRNNQLENLRWDTPSSNNFDRVKHGRHPATLRAICPQGHELREPNLILHVVEEAGHRCCLACNRAFAARRRARIRGVEGPSVQEMSDQIYALIMEKGRGARMPHWNSKPRADVLTCSGCGWPIHPHPRSTTGYRHSRHPLPTGEIVPRCSSAQPGAPAE